MPKLLRRRRIRIQLSIRRSSLDALIDARQLMVLDDGDLPAASFLHLLDQYGLGAGETECLALAKIGNHMVCCDDRRARKIIAGELGQKRVIGSLGLIVRAIYCNLLTIEAAFEAYEQMRRLGGFLPGITVNDLTRVLETLGPTSV
jgi:predicted nucleic acid-binding protein